MEESSQTWFRFKDPVRWDTPNLGERFPERQPLPSVLGFNDNVTIVLTDTLDVCSGAAVPLVKSMTNHGLRLRLTLQWTRPEQGFARNTRQEGEWLRDGGDNVSLRQILVLICVVAAPRTCKLGTTRPVRLHALDSGWTCAPCLYDGLPTDVL